MGEPLSENDNPQPAPAAAAQQSAQQPAATDRGFPEGVPIAEMNDAQRADYWQHYARKHEGTVKAYDGLTPQQVADLKSKVDALEADKLTADEKALKLAREEGSTAAATAAKAEYLPKLQAAEVKSIASSIISGDQLTSFMSIINTASFAGEDGAIDESKVMGALTGMFGAPQKAPAQRWQNAGQYSPPPPPGRPGEGGRAEAARRFGK